MTDLTRRSILAAPPMLGLTAIAAHAAAAPETAGAPGRSILAGEWDQRRLAATLLPADRWSPFPRYKDRTAWESLPADVRKARIDAASRTLGQPWSAIPATLLLEYKRDGNRTHFEDASFARRNRLRDLTVAECLEGRGRFLDDILNGVWLICEESWWGVPAHLGMQKAGTGLPDVEEPVVDLFASETGNLLAWTHYLLGESLGRISPLAPRRVALEIERRILEPCRRRIDFWWMGLNTRHPRDVNNWNPWINSNWLTCALLFETDEHRAAAVHKIMLSLDRFLDVYHEDGGCDEGPSYWNRAGASLFDCLDLLHSASNGRIDAFSHPLVREIGRYIYRAHVAADYYINFADAPARVDIAAATTYAYGRRIGDAKLCAQGAFALSLHTSEGAEENLGRDLRALFLRSEMQAAGKRAPLVRESWLAGIQVLSARRSEGSTDGLFLAAQGGHNAESHNHNDVGNFIVYAGGRPAIIDLGPEAYTAKTFSAQRYEIWTMRSAFHNCPLIHGVEQHAGRDFAARSVTCDLTPQGPRLRMDIAAAYPGEAGARSWIRQWIFDRATNTITVDDEWSLRTSGELALTLMSAVLPRAGEHSVALGDRVSIAHDASWKPVIEPFDVTDARLRRAWGERVWRVRLIWPDAPPQGRSTLRISQLG